VNKKYRIIKVTRENILLYFKIKYKWLWFWRDYKYPYFDQFIIYEDAVKYIYDLKWSDKSIKEEVVFETEEDKRY